jgi:hypothetical protein
MLTPIQKDEAIKKRQTKKLKKQAQLTNTQGGKGDEGKKRGRCCK